MMKLSLQYLFLVCIALSGCGQSDDATHTDHAHHHHDEVAEHMPRSLAHLCEKARSYVSELESNPSRKNLTSELTDLVAWAPEFAADTDMTEKKWIPIYELSEKIRLSIEKEPDTWDVERRDQIIRLCQISEDGWQSLTPDQQVDRYQDHDHDDHSHGHQHASDHGHEHEHGSHQHEHGEHEHGDHQHDDDHEESHDETPVNSQGKSPHSEDQQTEASR